MIEPAQANLAELFKELYAVRNASKGNLTIDIFEPLTKVSLKIIQVLLHDEGLARIIAQDLALILHAQTQPDQELALLGTFDALDVGLEKKLRGFSSMLLWILDEVSIRKDPDVLLREMPIDPKITGHFSMLARSLSAYLDLKEALAFKVSGCAAAIFLLFLKDLALIFWSETGQHIENLMDEWLKSRVLSRRLTILYQAILENTHHLEDLSRELMVIKLCQRVAQGGLINSHESMTFDEDLKSVGLMDLASLVRAGFLVLEGAPIADHPLIRLVK